MMNKIVWSQIMGKQDCGSYMYTYFSISIPVQIELEILSNQQMKSVVLMSAFGFYQDFILESSPS